MIRVYPSSKLSLGKFWLDLSKKWPDVFFTARWLKHVELKTPDTDDKAAEFWLQDEEDVLCSDAVLIYGTNGDKLRGALVEAGIAIAMRIPIIVVGNHPDYGSWQHHPNVIKVKDIDAAKDALGKLEIGFRRKLASKHAV